MIFIGLMAVLVLGVAFFHYVQGFFSATLSAILIIIAAVMAFSWHEVVVEKMLKGKMGNYSHTVTLLVLFCVIYVLLRVIFDKSVPAGIRLPAIADKIGAGVMGIIAGAFAVGVLAVAAEEAPFDAAPGNYARYAVQDRHAYIYRKSRNLDADTYDELRAAETGQFAENDRNSAYVDDLLIGTVRYLSEQGSLQGDQKLTTIHPDYLQELFGQRIGIQPGTIRVASNAPNAPPQMRIESIYTLPDVIMYDFYPDRLRDTSVHNKWTGPLPPTEGQAGVKFDKQHEMFVVIRMVFDRSASEKGDNLMRVSPGTVRLVTQQKDMGGEGQFVNLYPWGTVERDKVLFMDKPDDYLVASMSDSDARAIDFLYVVNKDGFLSADSKGGTMKVSDGTFVEFKRLDREDLSGKLIAAAAPPLKGMPLGVMHPPVPPGQPKPPFEPPPPGPAPRQTAAAPAPTTPPPTQQPTAAAPTNNAARGSMTSAQQNVASIGGKIFNYQSISKSSVLPTAVAVPSADLDKAAISVDATGVDFAHLKDKKFDKLSVNPKVSTTQLGTGDFKTTELSVPGGQVMYQITSAQPSDPWVWAQKVGSFKLRTSDNKQVAPNGIWAIIKEGSEDRLIARYVSDDTVSDAVTATQGTPTRITLAFLLPQGVTPKELTVDDQTVKELSSEPIK